MGEFAIGQSVLRGEDPRLLRGRGRFFDDLRLADQLYASIVRSPHAHADITGIDTRTALQMPGVHAVLTGADYRADDLGPLPSMAPYKRRDGGPMFLPPRPAIAFDRVMHVGYPVAVVVADALDQAQDAAERVVVDYAPQPGVVSASAAFAPEAPQLYDECPNNEAYFYEAGDKAKVDAAFAAAAHVVERRLIINRVTANPIEPRGVTGVYDAGSGRYTLHCGFQRPWLFRNDIARTTLKIPEAELRLITGDIGGSYGLRGSVYPEIVLMLLAAMKALGLGSNIMSLGGIAIAIGAMVDAAIVMIENAHKHLERAQPGTPRVQILIAAASEVGPALFFSLLIITASFLPIFSLEAQEGRLFKPLAYTKTFSMAAAALLSVTLVPALMIVFVRGRIIPEQKNPLNRFLIWLYRPIIMAVLRAKTLTILLALAVVAVTVWPASQIGSEFMPTLNEGTLFYMPTTLPGISVTKAADLLQMQDRIIKSFPEVESVFGKAGRASTATDPAPTEMYETVINLKPKDKWRPGMRVDSLIAEMDRALQFPGVSNAWTMPIKARIDMLSTGIRTPVGVKVFGTELGEMEKVARQIEQVLKTVPGTSSAYAERVIGGYYLNIAANRDALARYGLMEGDVQETVATALGGQAITTTVEGRERYTVNVRYPRDLRSDPRSIASDTLIALPNGGTVPLGEVASVTLGRGPTTIRTENGQLAAYIFVDIRDRDLGGYVADAQKSVAASVQLPPSYYVTWSGQFEYLQRAEARLRIVVPVTLLIIFLLLYLNFRRLTETLIVMLSLPFSVVGGVWLLWWLGFNFSVAVAVGFIALAGVAAETGVVMLIYLDHALREVKAKCASENRPFTRDDLRQAIMLGAVERVRPKMMTVVAIMAGLLPIMWSTGAGSEVMQRIAVPMIGGMISSTILTLIVIPAVYGLIKGWGLPASRPMAVHGRAAKVALDAETT